VAVLLFLSGLTLDTTHSGTTSPPISASATHRAQISGTPARAGTRSTRTGEDPQRRRRGRPGPFRHTAARQAPAPLADRVRAHRLAGYLAGQQALSAVGHQQGHLDLAVTTRARRNRASPLTLHPRHHPGITGGQPPLRGAGHDNTALPSGRAQPDRHHQAGPPASRHHLKPNPARPIGSAHSRKCPGVVRRQEDLAPRVGYRTFPEHFRTQFTAPARTNITLRTHVAGADNVSVTETIVDAYRMAAS
jgi:hypothetical protein